MQRITLIFVANYATNENIYTTNMKNELKLKKCSKDTAIRDINDLIGKDILQKEDAGGRSTNYELK